VTGLLSSTQNQNQLLMVPKTGSLLIPLKILTVHHFNPTSPAFNHNCLLVDTMYGKGL